MSVSLSIGPVVALIAGILILIIPRLLNYIIALYLIIIGVGLVGSPRALSARTQPTLHRGRAAHPAPTPVGPVTGSSFPCATESPPPTAPLPPGSR